MLRRVGFLGVLLIVVLTTASAGAPVQLSYVYSDSMEPTIGVNDGYILVPAGEVQNGDIVTFWSDERDAYVTHRIVGQTADGYLTKGDNNPQIDQETGYPPVTRGEIRGEVLTVGGEPLLIPQLGFVLATARANLSAVLALAGGVLALLWAREGQTRPTRDLTRVRDVAGPVFLVGFLAVGGLLVYGGSSHDIPLVAVESAAGASGPRTVLVGTAEAVETQIELPQMPLTTRVVGSHGIDVTTMTRSATNLSIEGTIHPARTIGPVPAQITVNRYPAVLPHSVLVWLHNWHPIAAASATSGLIFGPLWVLYWVAIDGREPIRRSRSRLWTILTEGFE
ncbi:signal peptidase I [Halospeciosus flavus]|uniref:Signal peptidase I n=3 Tax=Halospeciosus flavus TaxID=3032283 RepID=A0ABD5Z3M6_9EURY